MNFAFSEEQLFLREAARRFLDDKMPSERVRELMATEHGHDPALWQEMAEMGWQAMAIPEEYGGAGFSFLELVVILEEMGRVVMPSPFLATVILAANAIQFAGSEDQKKEILSGIAAGETIATVALTESSGRWDSAGVTATATASSDGWTLNGEKSFVIDGHNADILVIPARTENGVSLFLVNGDAPGLVKTPQEAMDQTRKLTYLQLDDVNVGGAALLGAEGDGWSTIERVIQLASVALAAEQVGGSQRVLDMAVEYAKNRMQFGRPIGSFQAIKHKCADMLVATESAKSAAYYAGWAASEDNEELPIVAPLAKAYCSEAYFMAAAENIQIHGGIGFTWEHDAHLYFKRAKSSELMFGDPAYHRSILADRIGI